MTMSSGIYTVVGTLHSFPVPFCGVVAADNPLHAQKICEDQVSYWRDAGGIAANERLNVSAVIDGMPQLYLRNRKYTIFDNLKTYMNLDEYDEKNMVMLLDEKDD